MFNFGFYRLMNEEGGAEGAAGSGGGAPEGGAAPDAFANAQQQNQAADQKIIDNSSGEANLFDEKDWRHQLPKEMQVVPFVKNFNNVGDLVKSYQHAQKLIGAEKIAKPSKNWGEEEWQMYYEQIGVPKELDKYEMTIPEGSHEGMMNAIKSAAHSAGILPAQMNKIVEAFTAQSVELEKEQDALYQQEQTQRLTSFMKEIGQDKFNGMQVDFATAAKQLWTPEEMQELADMGLGKDPVFIKAISKIAPLFGEDRTNTGDSGTAVNTIQEMEMEMEQLRGSDAWSNPNHSNRKATVSRVNFLSKKITELKKSVK